VFNLEIWEIATLGAVVSIPILVLGAIEFSAWRSRRRDLKLATRSKEDERRIR